MHQQPQNTKAEQAHHVTYKIHMPTGDSQLLNKKKNTIFIQHPHSLLLYLLTKSISCIPLSCHPLPSHPSTMHLQGKVSAIYISFSSFIFELEKQVKQ